MAVIIYVTELSRAAVQTLLKMQSVLCILDFLLRNKFGYFNIKFAESEHPETREIYWFAEVCAVKQLKRGTNLGRSDPIKSVNRGADEQKTKACPFRMANCANRTGLK